MLKAKGMMDGRPTVLLGLSFANLRRFLAEPIDTHILIRAEDMGLPHDIMIFSGATEAQLADVVTPWLVPGAKVHISDKLKQ